MKKFKTILLATFMPLFIAMMCGCDGDEPESGGAGTSNAKVEVTGISVGSKDKNGRYTVKIAVKAKNLASDETVNTIGAKWGTVESNPDSRDSRSNKSSATFTSAWHSKKTYYVTPFMKTSRTSGEITGETKSKKTP